MGNNRIDVDRWMAADEATSWRRQQIQGFFYQTKEEKASDRAGLHIIRDLSLAPGSQVVWQRDGDDKSYDECHADMMANIKRFKVQIIADEYENPSPILVTEAA